MKTLIATLRRAVTRAVQRHRHLLCTYPSFTGQ